MISSASASCGAPKLVTVVNQRAVVRANIIGDIAWVGGTAILVVIHATGLTTLGLVLLAGQGLAVGAVLVTKLAGARAGRLTSCRRAARPPFTPS